MKRVAWFSVVVFGTLMAVGMLWLFRDVVALFVVSLMVAAMVRPPVDILTGWRMPRPLAMLLIYLIGIGVGVVVILLVSPFLIQDLPRIVQDMGMAYDEMRASLILGNPFLRAFAVRLPASQQLGVMAVPADPGQVVADTAIDATLGVVGLLSQSILVLFLSIYWASDQIRFERLWLSLLPAEERARARSIWRAVEAGIGAYLRSEVAQSLLAGIVLAAGFSLIGLSYPVTIAVFVALAWLVPIVGWLIAAVPVLVIGLMSGPLVALLATGLTLGVLLAMELVVQPRLFPTERFGSILVLLIIIAMASVFGLAGLLIAPLLAAAIQITVLELVRPPAVAPRVAAGRRLESIRQRVTEARELLTQAEAPSPQAVNMLDRLSQLVAEAEKLDIDEPAEATAAS